MKEESQIWDFSKIGS